MDFLNGASHLRGAVKSAPGLTASVRKSPVLRSSPEQDDLLSPSPSDGKHLSSTRQEPSPLTTRSVNAGTSQKNGPRRNVKAPVAVPTTSNDVHDFSDNEGNENADAFTADENGFEDSFDAGNETVVDDDNMAQTADQDVNGADGDSSLVAGATTEKASQSKTTKKRSAVQSASSSKSNSKSTGRGRVSKPQHPADDDATIDNRPTKKPKPSRNQSQTTREPLDPELSRVVENYAQRSGPLKGRSLYILKKEDPSDSSSTHTRSGRVSIRPLAYWRNERCVYGDGEAAEGQRYPLSTIKEVVRTEELEPERKKKSKRSGSKSKTKKHRDDSSDEEDGDVDLWEKEGVLHGYVPRWDPKTQTATEEELLGQWPLRRWRNSFICFSF